MLSWFAVIEYQSAFLSTLGLTFETQCPRFVLQSANVQLLRLQEMSATDNNDKPVTIGTLIQKNKTAWYNLRQTNNIYFVLTFYD